MKQAAVTLKPTEGQVTTRRDFLKTAWGVLFGAFAAEAGLVSIIYSQPRLAAGEFGSVFNCGALDKFPNGSVTPFNEGRFYLVRLDDGGLLALYRKCTHLGCAVPWDQAQKQFICPCHASAFDSTGAVLNPPAPRPLDLFPVSIVNGEVQVDTGKPMQRDRFDKSQVVYA
jgi:cytochrome b6-f complex iron-sulfur subunit